MKGIDKALVVWAIIAVLIFGGLIAFGYFYKYKISQYKDYEKILVEGAKSYINNSDIYPGEKQTITIDIKDIIKSGFINKKDVIEYCSGAVKVSRDKNILYKPDIKCKYYHSSK